MRTGNGGNTGLQNIFGQAQKDAKLLMKDYFDEQSSATNSF